MVQATKRKNATPKHPAATSVDASANPPAVFVLDAAAATSAAIHTKAAGSRQSRPGLVHPPSQQQQGPRDITPSNPSKRSRRGKTPQARNVQSQQKGPDSKSKAPLQAPPNAPNAAATPKGQGEASSGSSTATSAATQKLNQAPEAAAAKGKKTKRGGRKHKAAAKGGSTCGASASAVQPEVSHQQTKASSNSQLSKAAVGSKPVGGASASVKASVALVSRHSLPTDRSKCKSHQLLLYVVLLIILMTLSLIILGKNRPYVCLRLRCFFLNLRALKTFKQ